jgi:hypothetical protein
VGTPRPGASPDGAHRPSRCMASSGTDLWMPGGSVIKRSRPAPARCRFRSTRFPPRSTGRLVDPPASPRVLRSQAPSQWGAPWAEQPRKGDPSGAFREGGQAQTCGCIASRATSPRSPLRGCGSRP